MNAYYNEIDSFCCRVLKRHVSTGDLPAGVIDSRDIREVQPGDILAHPQKHLFAGIGGFPLGFLRAGMPDDFDILTGGFPCQDLSVAGKRAGLAGEQSGLFWQLIRLVSAVRPAWLVLENVPGLLSSNEGRDMGAVVRAIQDTGYSMVWRVLDSQWFGVAQRRRRVFIVGHPDPGCAASVLFEPEGGEGNTAPMQKAGADVAHALDGRSGGVSGKENQETIVAAPLNARDNKRPLPSRGIGTIVSSSPNPDRVRETPGLPRRMDAPRYRALGNAVTVNVIEWIGRRIMKCDT